MAGRSLSADGGLCPLVLELLQSPAVPCDSSGCTVEAAAARLAAAIKAHGPELAAIGRFAATRSNRVHIVAGDHDAALLLPEPWTQVVTAIGAPAERVLLAGAGRWTSPDGRVHVEHGHQLPLSADRFSNWPNPIVASGGRRYIERPWGEHAVLPFYDRHEPRYPIVDNIAEEGVGAEQQHQRRVLSPCPRLYRVALEHRDRRVSARPGLPAGFDVVRLNAAEREHWHAHRGANLAQPVESLRRSVVCLGRGREHRTKHCEVRSVAFRRDCFLHRVA